MRNNKRSFGFLICRFHRQVRDVKETLSNAAPLYRAVFPLQLLFAGITLTFFFMGAALYYVPSFSLQASLLIKIFFKR